MTRTTTTYRATFGDTTATRTTEADYPFASCRKEWDNAGWVIRFHKTYAAARRRAGSDSGVVRTAVVYAVAMVKKAMPDNWQAAMTFLERRYPGQFARRLEVKTDPTDREPARFDVELAAAATETWRGIGLPEGYEVDDVLPALEAGDE